MPLTERGGTRTSVRQNGTRVTDGSGRGELPPDSQGERTPVQALPAPAGSEPGRRAPIPWFFSRERVTRCCSSETRGKYEIIRKLREGAWAPWPVRHHLRLLISGGLGNAPALPARAIYPQHRQPSTTRALSSWVHRQ
jgi:hypothetical protein